jgi:hypothetical protein
MRLIASLAFLALFAGCTPATSEPIDAAHLAGHWELRTGSEVEWLKIDAAGTFTGTIHGRGFLAETLSQGPNVSLNGDWSLDGDAISFSITNASDDTLIGQVQTYQIEALTNRTMKTTGPDGAQRELIKGI